MTAPRILVVEDEAIVAMDVRERLASLGYQVAGHATTGEQAAALAERERPDLVLMDIRLRGAMDGIVAAEKIRQRCRRPIVFLTACAEDGTLERAKQAEPFGYLLKPFEDRELKSTIEIALYKHRAEEEIRRLTRLYDVLSQVNRAVVRVASREELLASVCRFVVERGGADLAWIGWHDPATGVLRTAAAHGRHHGLLDRPLSTAPDCPEGSSAPARAFRDGRPCICNACRPEACPYPAANAPARVGLCSCGAFPIRSRGSVVGTLTLVVAEPGFFQAREVELLTEVAMGISFALDKREDDKQRASLVRDRETSLALLRLLNDQSRTRELIREIIQHLQWWSGCEAVGIRLRDGDDFPYFETRGFPAEFVEAERHLCARDAAGAPVRDARGNPVLECMCGNILCGRCDPALPFFTEKGSFWTNSTSRLLAETSEADRQARTRNRCNGEGYESVALIPLRHAGQPLGLLQLNACAKGRFTPELLAFLESAADQIAIGLAQRQAHAALAESEARYRALVESSADWVWEVDTEARYTFASSRVEAFLGYPPEEVLGRTPFDFMPDAEAARVKALFAEIAAARRPFTGLENTSTHREGRPVVLETSGGPILGPQGNLLGYRGVDRDITERKHAEEALRLDSEIMANMPGGVVLIRAGDGTILQANAGFEQMLGYGRDELVGMCITSLTAPSGKRPEEIAADIQGRLRASGMWFGEVLNRRKNGTTLWCEASVSTFDHSRHGKVWVAVHTDITERMRLEEQLRHAQKMEAIGQLAGGVAHDLNNLLVPILGYGEFLRDELAPGDERRELVEDICGAGQRARDLVRQLLTFSRRQPMELRMVDLSAVVTGFEKLLRRTLREDLALRLACAAPLPPIRADVGQLEQVLMNLAVNAQDATPGPGRLTITTDLAILEEPRTEGDVTLPPGPTVRLVVADTGSGMDAGTLRRVFEPFFTTKELGRGTGLGLPTVYGIVQKHGGLIEVASAPGQGTTFTISFPPAGQPAAAASKDSSPRLARPAGSGGTVLLAEDNAGVRGMVARALRQRGYVVLAGASGADCLRLLEAHRGAIDLVLTDVVISDTSGKALYEAVAARRPGVPVLYMSGYPDETIAPHGVLAPGTHFLQKPFTGQGLLAKMQEVLGVAG